MEYLKVNEYQTPITEELLQDLPKEVADNLLESIATISFVKNLISDKRERAKDRPRDESGRIIVDLANPHILENMEYFQQTAEHYKKYGVYNKARPNANSNSEYGKWIRQERDRCWNGMVRPEDGEWIPGPLYFYINYCPIIQSKIRKGTKQADRIVDFPEIWEGIYWRFHYMHQARNGGLYNDFMGSNHGAELASRGKSKSYSMASILTHNFILGENKEAWKETRSIVTAYQKEYLIKDGVLNKFISMADFIAQHTQFPRKRIKSTLQDMNWVMGYRDADLNIEKGTQNQVLGVSSKDDESKLRGKRAVFIGIEEFGTFKRLLDLYNVLIPSVQEGDYVFGLMYLQGCVCAGTKVWNQYGEMKNIEDVVLQDKLLSYNSIENISWLQPNTKKECVRITTEGGKYIECSIDHPLIALNTDNYNHSKGTCSFYKANELKVGDNLISPKKIGSFGDINEPNAFLLGSLFGDGSYGDNSCVTLSISTEEEYEFYNSKYDINISKLSKGKNTYAQIYFRKLHPLLKKYGMDKQVKSNKKLPNNIFQWDKESICNFLGGYFNADGNVQIVKNKHRSIKLSCKYEETLIQIQNLLSKIGISSHIYSENKKENVLKSNVNQKSYIIKDRTCYVLYINRSEDIITFRNNIKLLQKSKQNKLNSYIEQNSKGYYKTLNFKLRDNHKGEYFVGKTIDDVIGLSIKKIEPIGYQTIYNMTADTTHTYISNGFISANTAGDNESDFAGAQEIMYNPLGYNMYALPNVYDKANQGRKQFVFFYPGYVNRKGFYNKDGVSDVIGALISILKERYKIKYNSTDPNTIIKTIAEVPITPAEAIVKTGVNLFPVIDLTERLNQLDNNPREYDDVYSGDLVITKSGEIQYKNTAKNPIRTFKNQDNQMEGAVEILQMPEKDASGKIFPNRYILSCDPYDNDQAESKSLGSVFVLDLWTDRIVAEYTGRPMFADDFYEIARRMCLFYNGRMNYENNKKGLFAYFQRMNSLYLLTDALEFLRDKELSKTNLFGNNLKGTTATEGINSYARGILRNWLLQPVSMVQRFQDDEVEVSVPRLFTLRNRALIEELISYNEVGNFDRVSSMMMLMLLREERMIRYNGNLLNSREETSNKGYLGNDPFFETNYRPKQIYNK